MPSGLKPALLAVRDGTAEACPFRAVFRAGVPGEVGTAAEAGLFFVLYGAPEGAP